jgi:tyrosine-protein phosphatase
MLAVSDSASPTTPSRRNMKKLSITLPLVNSNQPPQDPQTPTRHRRPSVASLPTTSISLHHRREEEGSPTVPYLGGPIEIMPGIWLGSEDNARDWKGLVERRIRSILNVAKEVVSPFDSAQPFRPFASTPNLKTPARPSDSTYYPAHLPSGRPSMHYLKLQWSHGQQDLVKDGFPAAMAFIDAALTRGEGVLIQYLISLFIIHLPLICPH